MNRDYEPSFYRVGEELFYLPDFYLPDHQLWLEVKGAPFMDAASMAKCLGSVAGLMRIPLREAPYTASDRLLLGGPFRALKHGLIPVRTPHHPGRAEPGSAQPCSLRHPARWGSGGHPSRPGLGHDRSHRCESCAPATPARLQLLLEPEPQLQVASIPDRITRACQGAFRTRFDDISRNISDHELLAAVSRRRSGRPFGIAASTEN